MSGEDFVAQLVAASSQLARTASHTGLDRPLPTCPGWTLADLLRHLSELHSRAARTVRGRAADGVADSEVTDDQLLGRFIDRAEQLVLSVQAASGRAGTAREFWSRRMAHETTLHSLDVEIAADTGMLDVPAWFAADGITELIADFAPSNFVLGNSQPPRSITLMPLDVNLAWTVSLSPSGASGSARASDSADLTAAGMAADLYRWAWNRAGDDAVSLSGDQSLADLWHAHFIV